MYYSTTTTSCYTLIRLGNNFESCTQLHVSPKKGTDRTTAYTHIKINSFLHTVYMLSTEISLYKDLALQLKFCPISHISGKIVKLRILNTRLRNLLFLFELEESL